MQIHKILSSHKFASDVLYTVCYSTVMQCGGAGGFVSIDGWSYFDAVIGSYRDIRKGNSEKYIRLWEYPDLSDGQSSVVCSVYVYQNLGWKVGVDSSSVSLEEFIAVADRNITAAYPAYHISLRVESFITDKDMLTGLFTRKKFFADLKASISTAKKLQMPLHMLYIDLNNFKVINDYFGHSMGDRVLRSMAHEIKNVVAEYGGTYRIGGDEFATILIGIDKFKVDELVNRIESVTEQAPCGILVNASVGVVAYNEGYGDGNMAIGKMIKKADSKMYKAKQNKQVVLITCDKCPHGDLYVTD